MIPPVPPAAMTPPVPPAATTPPVEAAVSPAMSEAGGPLSPMPSPITLPPQAEITSGTQTHDRTVRLEPVKLAHW
jgi:hypothetical protein